MGMTLAAGPDLTLLALALNGGARCLVDVMMNGPVAMDVNMLVNMTRDLQRRDLLGDFIEAIGRDGAVRAGKRQRRHDDASKVGQRDQGRDAASCPAGRNSKH